MLVRHLIHRLSEADPESDVKLCAHVGDGEGDEVSVVETLLDENVVIKENKVTIYTGAF
jgi:hypothetical protein